MFTYILSQAEIFFLHWIAAYLFCYTHLPTLSDKYWRHPIRFLQKISIVHNVDWYSIASNKITSWNVTNCIEKRFECKMNIQKLFPGRSQAVPKISTKNVTIDFLGKGIVNFQMIKCNLLKKNKIKILYLQQLSSVKSGNLEVTKGA